MMRCTLVLLNVTIAILRNSSICIITNIITENSVHFLIVRKFCKIESFYDVGLSSEFVEFFKCSLISAEHSLIRFSEVYKKCYLMPLLQRKHDHEGNQLEDSAFNLCHNCVFIVATIL